MDSERHKTGFGIDDILNRDHLLKRDTYPFFADRQISVPMDFTYGPLNFEDNARTENHSYEELFLPHGLYCQHTNPLYKSSLPSYSSPLGIYPSPQQHNKFSCTHPYLPYFLPHPGLVISGYQSRRKGGQIRFTADQTKCLESKFENVKYLSPDDRRLLAMELKLSDRQVKTWFQNRRAKWRRFCNGCLPTTVNDNLKEGSHNNQEFFEGNSDANKNNKIECKNHESIGK